MAKTGRCRCIVSKDRCVNSTTSETQVCAKCQRNCAGEPGRRLARKGSK